MQFLALRSTPQVAVWVHFQLPYIVDGLDWLYRKLEWTMLSKSSVNLFPPQGLKAIWTGGRWELGVTAVLGLLLILHGLGKLLRRLVLVSKFTIMDDLPGLGRDRTDGKFAGRAVICGGRSGSS